MSPCAAQASLPPSLTHSDQRVRFCFGGFLSRRVDDADGDGEGDGLGGNDSETRHMQGRGEEDWRRRRRGADGGTKVTNLS